jgi:hypothetical protein
MEHWRMTSEEFKAWEVLDRKEKIAAWNESGSKGFPPTSSRNSIFTKIRLAERAGYVLPGDKDLVINQSYHSLCVQAALASGCKVPQNVIESVKKTLDK